MHACWHDASQAGALPQSCSILLPAPVGLAPHQSCLRQSMLRVAVSLPARKHCPPLPSLCPIPSTTGSHGFQSWSLSLALTLFTICHRQRLLLKTPSAQSQAAQAAQSCYARSLRPNEHSPSAFSRPQRKLMVSAAHPTSQPWVPF